MTFRGARHHASRTIRAAFTDPRRPPGSWLEFKALAEVEPGVSATVVVPERHRDSLLLGYRPADSIPVDGFPGPGSPYFRKSAGDPAVRFAACPPPPEGKSRVFAGSFLVKEPGCYEIEVISDEDPEPQRATLGIAVGRQGCSDEA